MLNSFASCLMYNIVHAGPAESVQCYCDERRGLPPAPCLLHNNKCNSTTGCYLRRWYSHENGEIQQSWGCILWDPHEVHVQIDYSGVYCGDLDTPDNAYKCCNSSDFCNKHLSITLPIETFSPVSPSPSLLRSEPDNSRG